MLLEGFTAPLIIAYSTETLIAEKFQAMIELSLANSRMKDFYDVYKLIESQKINRINLELAIIATFKNRNTPYTENHSLFEETFFTYPSRVKMWKAFLNKIGKDNDLGLEKVGETIKRTLQPIWDKMKE